MTGRRGELSPEEGARDFCDRAGCLAVLAICLLADALAFCGIVQFARWLVGLAGL